LYRVRWLTLAVAVAFIVVATLQAWWVATTPEALAMMGSRAELEAYREQFINYYSEYSGTSFTSVVWTNNAWLAAQAIGFGITGVFPAYLLLQNALGIGGSAGALASIDSLDVFLLYIAPHGQL